MKRNVKKIVMTAITGMSLVCGGNCSFAANISVYVDSTYIQLTDSDGNMVAPFIQNGTTYVPLRGVSTALNCQIEWNGVSQTIDIYKNTVSPNGATLSEIKPYNKDGIKSYYESNGEVVDIDGIQYSNALTFWRSIDTANTEFNLNGKYKKMTFVLAHYKRTDYKKTISFIVDGKIVDSYNIEPDETSKEVSIDLNYGLQLKITSSNDVGMGNIVFY